jgi:hypothetical protein
MLSLKMDLYQPKLYATIPITYSVTACPPGSAVLEGKYGVGTVFSGINPNYPEGSKLGCALLFFY